MNTFCFRLGNEGGKLVAPPDYGSGLYQKGTVDFFHDEGPFSLLPLQRRLVEQGPQVCEELGCIKAEFERIRNMNLNYQIRGPNNCNGTTSTILSKCGFSFTRPWLLYIAPGWGQTIP